MPRLRPPRLPSRTLATLVGFLILCPVLMLLLGSLSQGPTSLGQFTLSNYPRVYTDPSLWDVALNTMVFVLGASLLSTLLALCLAYLNTRTDIPGKPLFALLPFVPMVMPHLLFSAGWALLLNPGDGLINQALQGLFGLESAPFNIYSLWGMTLVEGLLDLPIAYLIIMPAMAAFDPALEEAARVSGSDPAHLAQRITWPILQPALLAALILVIARSLASYAVPRILGAPGHVDVLSTYLYDMIATGAAPGYGRAAALGMGMLSAAIALIALYRALIAKGRTYATAAAGGFRSSLDRLGRMRRPLGLAVGLLCLLATVSPVLALLYTSLVPHALPSGAHAFAAMDLRHWIAVFHEPDALRALRNSLFLAVVGATLGVTLSLGVAYLIAKTRGPLATGLEKLTALSFSFPGIVIGIGFMGCFARTPLHATLAALLLAYLAVYLPYGVQPLAGACARIHSRLEESSRVCGAGHLTTLRRIVIPLLAPGIVSAWTLLATLFLNELAVSVVLSQPGTEVLSTRILGYADEGRWGPLSALGLCMIAMSTTLVLGTQAAGHVCRRRPGR